MRVAPKRLRKRPPSHPWPDVDVFAAANVAELVAVVRIDGREVPFVRPRRFADDQQRFDAALCRAGVKEFARETMEGDWPDFAANPGPHVLVAEIRPGARIRHQAVVTLEHELN